jgi:hypothetical protein
MFNEYQILILQSERENRLAREWQNQEWLRQAQEARKRTLNDDPRLRLRQTIRRTFAIALLVVLLALGLTNIAGVYAFAAF